MHVSAAVRLCQSKLAHANKISIKEHLSTHTAATGGVFLMGTEYGLTENERARLETLREMEELAAKKAGIYSRLLIDARLAQEMESLAKRHQERGKRLEILLFGEPKKQNDGGRYGVNEDEA